jgi:ABC-type lipoprotein release transport system permease subunit
MELVRYLLINILKRPMRAAFIIAAGALSSLVLVFAASLGLRVTAHIHDDTIAKWTGHLWISAADDFAFKEGKEADYLRQAEAVRGYLAESPDVSIAVPWVSKFYYMQVGTAREHVEVRGMDTERDLPYRNATELVSGAFPGPEDEYGLLLSSAMAGKYGLEVGDSVTLFVPSVFGARNAVDFIVTGICRASAPWYESTVCVRASDYLAMTELGDMSPFYKVYVKDESAIPRMVSSLAAFAPDFVVKGYGDDAFVRFLLSLGTSNIAVFGTMAMIIFLALLIGINSIILSNVFDRRDEIGTLRAIGFPRGTVRNLFFGEALISLVAGYILGVGAVAAIGAYFEAALVRPPLVLLEYMFGMTRMGISLTPLAVVVPLILLLSLLFIASYRRIGLETEKQAVAQMASR